jgi:hypothetical protein
MSSWRAPRHAEGIEGDATRRAIGAPHDRVAAAQRIDSVKSPG